MPDWLLLVWLFFFLFFFWCVSAQQLLSGAQCYFLPLSANKATASTSSNNNKSPNVSYPQWMVSRGQLTKQSVYLPTPKLKLFNRLESQRHDVQNWTLCTFSHSSSVVVSIFYQSSSSVGIDPIISTRNLYTQNKTSFGTVQKCCDEWSHHWSSAFV